MATTENTYTGDGTTVLYSFTFPYLETTDVFVSVNGTDLVATTEYIFANATTLQLTTAPALNAAVRIYRKTDSTDIKAAFFPGSAIRAQDLNDNFTQNNYVNQESVAEIAKATTVANTAKTTADSSLAASQTTTTTANQALADSATAISTANTANTAAANAVASATTAVTTASNAVATANAAQNAVASAAFYSPYATLSNLPASPSNLDRAEVADSTNVQTTSSVSGVPTGFIGSPGLTIRLQYSSSLSKWEWQNYFANDSENRYLTKSTPVVFGDSTNGSGQITLNCENNSHGVVLKSPPHSAAASYTLTFPDNTGSIGQYLTTNGTGSLSWTSVTSLGNNLDLGNNRITNLANPTAAQDAATKTFVERKAVAMALMFS